MSTKEVISSGMEVVAQSIIQSPAPHAVAITAMGTGAVTGSLIVQMLAGAASLAIVVNTIYSIVLTRLKIKNEKTAQAKI